MATHYQDKILSLYNSIQQSGEYKLDAKSMGQRELKAKCFAMLINADGEKYHSLAFDHYNKASNMTEEISFLSALVNANSTLKQNALEKFYKKWKHETLVMQKWLTVQAATSYDETFDQVIKLESDSIYDKTVPNIVRALLGTFSGNNLQFNHSSGRGYKLIADRIIEIDKMNPQVASRFASQFKTYKRLPADLKNLMGVQLDRIIKTENLSKNVTEIISKILE